MKDFTEIQLKAVELFEEDRNATHVYNELLEIFGEEVPQLRTVQKRLSKVKNQTTSLKEDAKEVFDHLNETIVDKKNYVIKEDVLVMHKKVKNMSGEDITQEYTLPIDLVSDIVFDYSRYGGNISGMAVQEKYHIKPEVWNLLKSRLNIYKDTNACPDVVLEYIEEKYGEEEALEKIESTSYRAIKSKYKEKYKLSYEKSLLKQSKNAVRRLGKIENYLELLQNYIKDYEPIEFTERLVKPVNNDTIDVMFADIHMGKRGTQDIIDRINSMASYILSRPETNVNLIFLGDLIEALVEGGMHPGQVEDMDGPYGFDLILKTSDVLVNLINTLYKNGKNVTFYGIPGNHDRVTQKNENNPERSAGLIVFELIKRSIEALQAKNNEFKAQINYFRKQINVFETEEFNYMIMHDINKSQKAKPETLLWNNIPKNGKYTIIAAGHEHGVQITEGKNYTLALCPALAGPGQYDEKLDLHSSAGILVNKQQDGLADILLKRIK